MSCGSEPIRRAPDWQTRLSRYIRQRRNIPFEWGVNDCATFACDGIAAMTGVDPARSLKGYRTRRGADRALKKHGFADLKAAADALAEEHGFPPVDPAYAQRGDLVLVETERGQCLGLVSLGIAGLAIANFEGVAFVSRRWATQAWRI